MVAALFEGAYGTRPLQETADLLGISVEAASRKMTKMGWRQDRWLPENVRDRIIDLTLRGHGARYVANRLGIDIRLVEHHVAKARTLEPA